MNAILLCAGDGRRLLPLTKFYPKPLVEINYKKKTTLIDYWIEKLIKEFKVEKILINLNYKANLIKLHLNKSPYRNKIRIVYEKKKLGTAGTLIKNINFFENKDGILLHSDNICDENLKNFLKFHKKQIKDNFFSMLAFKTNDKKNSGILKIKNNIMINFYEKIKDAPGNLANGAIYIINKKFLEQIKFKDYKDFSNDIVLRSINKVAVFKTNKFFIDIGTLKKINYLKNRH